MANVSLTVFHNTKPARTTTTDVFFKNTIMFPKYSGEVPEEHVEVSRDTMFRLELWLGWALQNKPALLTKEAAHNVLKGFEGTRTTVTIGPEMRPLKAALYELIAA